jgi:hypothetical protein
VRYFGAGCRTAGNGPCACYPCRYPEQISETAITCSTKYIFDFLGIFGGRTRARTWDPMIKSHLLYQLSYAPGTGPEKTLARGPSFSKATPRCPANWARFSRPLEGARNGEKSSDSSDFSAGFNLRPRPCPQSRPDPLRSGPRSRPSSSRSKRSMPRSKRCWRQPSAPNRCPIWVRTASRRFWPSSSVL